MAALSLTSKINYERRMLMAAILTTVQRDAFTATLQARFDKTPALHQTIQWDAVLLKLQAAPDKLDTLHAMETTSGEPCVVFDPEQPEAIVFMDCAKESPANRRSLCYDEDARLSRKANPPADSAVHMAQSIGIQLLSETQYRTLQAYGDFDLKTSSWVQTPASIRGQGGAVFCDKRYGQVFLYHNGADSYYASRGFRGYLVL